MTYGAERWTLGKGKSDETKINSAEIWCYTRLLRLGWK